MGIDDETVAVYRRLAAEGKLPLRVYAYLAGGGRVDSLPGRRPDADPDGTAMFVLRGVKLFADGALGSRGAALLAPYDDDPQNRGLTITPPEELARAAKIAAESGFQLAVHAIGDRANRSVLDAFAAAGAGAGRGRDLRFRVEHAQVLSPEDVPRFAALGVVASMQPAHATSDMPWAAERASGRSASAGRTPGAAGFEAGGRLALGSDFPGESADPRLGLYAAVTRQDLQGNPPGGWLPGERLTREEALRGFTLDAAWSLFLDHEVGSLAVGKRADLTVFGSDPMTGPEIGIAHAPIDYTLVDGKVVYQREGSGR